MADLQNWRALTEALRKATEPECLAMLEQERDGDKRPAYLNRIYGRYSVMRMVRERRELLGEKKRKR